ncbi:hypothetical protein HPP92_023883 [Vanilla planifolia]|uniref:DCD domain-containing protein n=1 Tax=Vanilla planifolia TaxID=51239 RepID=A0A835PLV5_VANPL|nr:hypothetical protein HPP92_023883 [Vanilla planifolia]
MNNGREESSFWNFSDQLRLHTAGMSSLSLGDSIWSDPFLSTTGRRMEDRRNLDIYASSAAQPDLGSGAGWKVGFDLPQKLAFGQSSLGRYNYSNEKDLGKANGVNNYNLQTKNYFNKAVTKAGVNNNNSGVLGNGKKNNEVFVKGGKNKKNNNGNQKESSGNNSSAVDKRFKTLPPSEALPKSEAVGGYIFVCNNETMEENLKRQLFGLPSRYRDSVRAITPGLPIFLYNYSNHQLHGIFEASSFGGTNIDPAAWEDKKHPGESRFPAQVRVVTRKICKPLEEDSFRPILHHYDGPKFRLELSVAEALALLDVFAENSA